MVNQILLYVGAFLTCVWGVAHLFPTKSVVAGSGEITVGNKRSWSDFGRRCAPKQDSH